ncbi:hypothetical protein [Oceanobacillus kimchii]|uniref:hypothetical protein n=1 Tax=Oceanobacillus kimchii TaxID=746691 RepID=UPI00036D4892|nr:hypothetical protein [Oceanobacillus kimchii]
MISNFIGLLLKIIIEMIAVDSSNRVVFGGSKSGKTLKFYWGKHLDSIKKTPISQMFIFTKSGSD